jgi:WD40 repeat protein
MPTFACSHCGQAIRVQTASAGQVIRCQHCRANLRISAPTGKTTTSRVGPSAAASEERTLPPAHPRAAASEERTLPPGHSGAASEERTLPPGRSGAASEGATLPPQASSRSGAVPGPTPDSRRVPGYEILGELGRGGMGVVYKARDLRLKRLAALKMVLGGGHAGEQELARFRTEAEAVARLQHPNIVGIYEVGVHDGLPYFALEFCSGGSLDRKLDGTPLPAQQAAALTEKLSRAMQAAHDKDVIHRDLKPANVLLAEDGTPKITDFGLAKKLDEAGQTRTGSIMGTPSYMAPEQAGGGKDVGPAADVYALGAILYELLTGRPPFKATTPLDTVMQVLSDEPVPPTQLQSRTPHDLETIALKCLQKEPARRYASAAELADDLRRFQEGRPIAARPVGRLERGWRWCRRNPVVAGLLLAVAAALLLGMTGASFFAVRADSARQRADIARDTALQEKRAADEARGLAMQEKKAADEARRTAERERDRNAWLLYTGRITLAQREWQDNNAGQARALIETCPANLRGWEYHYLHNLFRKNQQTFRGHGTGVTSVSWRPDGKRLVSGAAWDGAIKVWDVDGQKELFSCRHDKAGQRVASVAWSPNGKRFASGGWDGTVKVWDGETGQQVQSLEYGGQLMSLSWGPDGKRLAAAGINTPVKCWELATGRKTELPGIALCVALSPDGKQAAGGYPDGLLVWEVASGQETACLKGAGPFLAVSWSPDGKLLAGTGNKIVQLWDVAASKATRTITVPGGCNSVAWSPDGKHLVTGGGDRAVQVWDAATGQQTSDLKGHADRISCVAWSNEGRQLASSSDDGTVKVWSLGPGQDALIFKAPEFVRSVSWSGNGERLAIATFTTVKVWDVNRGEELFSFSDKLNPMASVCSSPDGKRLVRNNVDGTLQVWDVEEKKRLHQCRGHSGPVRCVSWSPDGKYIASGGEDNKVKVWEALTGQEVVSLEGHTAPVLCVCWVPDSKRLASAGFDNTARIWNVATGKETINALKHPSYVQSVCWKPDGQRLASAAFAHNVTVWDAATGREVLTLEGHGEKVTSVSWSPDGRRLAGCAENKVKVWDEATGEQTLSCKGQSAWTCVSWSPTGSLLAAGSVGGNVKVWDGQPRPGQP